VCGEEREGEGGAEEKGLRDETPVYGPFVQELAG